MILEHLRSSRTIHPLICIAQALLTFTVGLTLVRVTWFWAFLLGVLCIQLCFGYAYTLRKIMPAFTLLGLAVMLITLLYAAPAQALQAAYRVLLIGLSAAPTLSMKAIDLVRAFNQLRAPRWLTLAFLIALRFTRMMSDEMKRIRLAMRLRGVSAAWYRPAVIYRAFIMPLIVRIMGISDLLAVSLETRGFSMERESTQAVTIRVRSRDLVYLAVILLFLGIALLLHRGRVLV